MTDKYDACHRFRHWQQT